MKHSKKGKFEFIDFKIAEASPEKQMIDSQIIDQPQFDKTDLLSNPQIRISPFDLKQKMPFCYANYSMMNNQASWLNSDEDSLKKIGDSMVSQIITVDCGGSTTTTQVASSTTSSCSLPANEDKLHHHYMPTDYEIFKPACSPDKQSARSKSLLDMIDIDQQQKKRKSFDKNCIDATVTDSTLTPLTLEWTNLSCEISTKKSFLSNMFNCFIHNERSNIYNNSESSSLNDLNRDSEASSYQLEQMFRNRRKGKKLILDKQSGQFKSGTLNAIIGASGAVCKSTLLECISGRRLNGVNGTVNVYANTEIFGKNVTLAYLGQVESLINVLTVREVLLFASRLKNYKKISSYEQHVKLVNSVISEFKLECCADNYIHSISGGQLKRVSIASEIIWGPDIIVLDEPTSGLDSCTAYTCIKLLRKITGLVDHQQHYRAPIVICSIHQPSIQLLNEFHNLYVLSNNGRCIYQGSSHNMVKYLAQFNLICPKYHDPVNYITQLASGYYGFDVIHHLAEQERILQEQRTLELHDNLFVKTNMGSNAFKNYAADVIYDVIGCSGGSNQTKLEHYESHCPKSKKQFYQTNKFQQYQLPEMRTIKISSLINQMKSQSFPFLYHTLLLTKRTYFGTIREPKLTWLRIFQALFIGFLMSFLYDHPIGDQAGCWSEAMAIKEILNPMKNNNLNDNLRILMDNLDPNNATERRRLIKRDLNEHETKISEFLSQNKLNHQLNSKAITGDNVAFVFFVTLFLVMSSMMPTVLTFPSEVRVLQAEKNNGYYSCGPYYLAKIISDTPFVILNAILFCSIVYPLTGQLLEWRVFLLFTFVAIVAALIAHCIGMLFGTIYVHSVTSAVFMAPLSMSPVFLFSGFFGKISSLPLFLKPVAYMSYVRYCFECFLIALYGFDRCKITHNRTFFLHRTLHNWTLFQREKDLFFGWNKIETTSLPSLPTNPQALIQNNPFNFNASVLSMIPESSRSILSTNLPNELFKKFSSYMVDRNLLNKLQASLLKNNNNTIDSPNLLTRMTNEATNNNLITNAISTVNSSSDRILDTLSSTLVTTVSTVSNTMSSIMLSTLSPSTLSTTTMRPTESNDFAFTMPNEPVNQFFNSNASSVSPISTFELLNENEISHRNFNNITRSLVLEFYTIDDDVFWHNIMFLTAIFIFLRIIAYIILVIKTNKFK